jgi:hypothetical protein
LTVQQNRFQDIVVSQQGPIDGIDAMA